MQVNLYDNTVQSDERNSEFSTVEEDGKITYEMSK